ncbi:PRC-barrel domain-containing protein [Caballeronia grimmiae]|nr:PRC-barrel domain-containing protein [Caballeronia grimmiae]
MMNVIALDGLVGMPIHSRSGKSVGRIAGIVAEERGGECVVVGVQVNSHGFSGRVMRWMLNAFTPSVWRGRSENSVRTYAWESIDWTDLQNLRLHDA